jgi:hypothetical protein
MRATANGVYDVEPKYKAACAVSAFRQWKFVEASARWVIDELSGCAMPEVTLAVTCAKTSTGPVISTQAATRPRAAFHPLSGTTTRIPENVHSAIETASSLCGSPHEFVRPLRSR